MQLRYAPQVSQKQTVFLSGDLNASALSEVRQIFDVMATSQAEEVIVDLSDVRKLDASGVGALVFLFKRLRNSKRSLSITGVKGQPEAIIRLLRMEKAIKTQFVN